MAIDLSQFRELVSEKWREFATNPKEAAKNLGLATSYGLLTSSAFLPLAQAYVNDPTATTLALTTLASGVGISLLSNFVQKVFDKHLSAAELEKATQDDPELRAVLDVLIAQSNSLESAQQALGEKWENFSHELKADLEKLNHTPASLTTLSGPNINNNSSQIVAPLNISLNNGSHLTIQGNVQLQNTVSSSTPIPDKVSNKKNFPNRKLKRKEIYRLELDDIQQANKVLSEWHFVKTFQTEPFGTLDSGVLGIGQPEGSTFNRSPIQRIANCSIECDIRILNNGGHPDNWAGLRVRGFWDDIQFGFLVYLRSEGTVELYRAREVLGGKKQRIISDTLNNWTNIRVDIFDDNILVFVNREQQPHITAKDKTFGNPNYIYLHTYGVQAQFKDFCVYKLTK